MIRLRCLLPSSLLVRVPLQLKEAIRRLPLSGKLAALPRGMRVLEGFIITGTRTFTSHTVNVERHHA